MICAVANASWTAECAFSSTENRTENSTAPRARLAGLAGQPLTPQSTNPRARARVSAVPTTPRSSMTWTKSRPTAVIACGAQHSTT